MAPGELYTTDERYLLLVYPTREHAVDVGNTNTVLATTGVATAPEAEIHAAWWSKFLGCQVRWVEPGSSFMMLEASVDSFVHVLFGDFDGWIIEASWLQLHKLTGQP